jgi:hypothetical protein
MALDRAFKLVLSAIKASFGCHLPRREVVLLARLSSSLKTLLASMNDETIESMLGRENHRNENEEDRHHHLQPLSYLLCGKMPEGAPQP